MKPHIDVEVHSDTRAIVFSGPLMVGEGPGALLRHVADWLDERPRLTAYSVELDEDEGRDRWLIILVVGGWRDDMTALSEAAQS